MIAAEQGAETSVNAALVLGRALIALGRLDDAQQALERAATDQGNKGFDVTVTALEMAQTMRELDRRLPGDQG